MNENEAIRMEEARKVAECVVNTMLRTAFDPARTDDRTGAEAAKFVFRVRREGLFVASLDSDEHAVSPPSMLDPAVAEAANGVLVSADEICRLVARSLHTMTPELAANARRGLSGGRAGTVMSVQGCSCCHPALSARQ